ncbi:hypothetical protein SAMN05421848_2619 [Kushneria avicenniae]|uniref:DUF3311 domain-containing protein n=1 Tax=Kushneria avicenniae TaxID=402385 RepID=A0A1I1LVN7_9GAMM|nr:hypothetical protein [Kushneria avicenniae]SFC75018.1 hypothetical protein SAMN05421848_2619 [Kushneria avicenniae]
MADYDIGPAAQKLRPRIIMPRSRRARGLLVAFMLLIAAGCWPVIMLFNRPAVVAGLPLMALWSYVIVFLSVALMALGNRLPREDSRAEAEQGHSSGESRTS